MTVKITVDLRSLFGPVRDQGQRPTCLAFAASDVHAAVRGGFEPLSCEFAFYNAQRRTGRSPLKGAFLDDMLATILETGQPIEADWPYLQQLPSDLSRYVPPLNVGTRFARDGRELQCHVNEVCGLLDGGRPTIILSALTRRYFSPPNNHVIDDFDGDAVFPVPRHAMIAVGYGTIGSSRVILIRNSWGSTWGMAGYCWLTENFLAKHMFGLAVLEEVGCVPSHSNAA